jgi:predicted ATPase/DNA-binding XRE family transcriptional regulator
MVSEQRPTSFGQLLRELRTVAGLTQEELAEQSGLSPRGISDIERGARRSPHPATVRRLSAALQLVDDDRARLETAAYRARAAQQRKPDLPVGGKHFPVQLTSFVGRDLEQLEIHRALSTSRLVTLSGGGGIGKTRLALAVAERAVPELADAVIVVELGALSDPSLVPRELASAIGIRADGVRPIVDSLLTALADARVLVVLDNCEHLLGACANLVAALLGSCERLRILATSRESLGVPYEQVWTVPPLALPKGGTSVERLAQVGAVRLFVDRARAVWPTFELAEDTAAAVSSVCCRLEGIPLAIELAAARMRVLSVQEIDARLLVWGVGGAPAHHQTLEAAVDWSYEGLSESEQLLFDRLSVFRGRAPLEAVEAVCGSDRCHPAETVDVLQSLVEKSLVVAEPESNGAIRFRQLETLREYAQTRLCSRGETDILRARHLEYLAHLAEQAAQGWT